MTVVPLGSARCSEVGRNFRRAALALIVAAAAAPGCSSKSGGDDPSSISSIDGTKKAADLTPTEGAQVCKDVSSYATRVLADPDVRKGTCTLEAAVASLMAGDPRTACDKVLAECLKATPTGGKRLEGDCTRTMQADFKKCPTQPTVGDIVACSKAQTDGIAASLRPFAQKACADVKPDEATAADKPQPKPECVALEVKCPGILSGGGSGGPGDAPPGAPPSK